VRTPVLHLIGGRIFGYFERDAAKYAESAFQITPFLPDTEPAHSQIWKFIGIAIKIGSMSF